MRERESFLHQLFGERERPPLIILRVRHTAAGGERADRIPPASSLLTDAPLCPRYECARRREWIQRMGAFLDFLRTGSRSRQPLPTVRALAQSLDARTKGEFVVRPFGLGLSGHNLPDIWGLRAYVHELSILRWNCDCLSALVIREGESRMMILKKNKGKAHVRFTCDMLITFYKPRTPSAPPPPHKYR